MHLQTLAFAQIIFSDIGTPKPDAFNIYDALKNKLITDFSIPANHITFILSRRAMAKASSFVMVSQLNKIPTTENLRLIEVDAPVKPLCVRFVPEQ